MSAKRSFASVPGVPDFVTKLAQAAPGGEALIPNEPEKEEGAITPIQEARPLFRERQAFQKMTVNMPKELYEELRVYMKQTDVPMSDVLVEGARRELARLKSQQGVD